MLNEGCPEQATARRDGSSSFEAPLTSPTISLSSSDSFASNCSDFSVDLNQHDGYNVGAGGSERCMQPNGQLSKSSTSTNAPKDSGALKKDNEVGNNGNVPGDLDSKSSFNSVDLNEDDGSSNDEFDDEENEQSPTFDDKEVNWTPPEAENDEDNNEFSMATLGVDDEECVDGDGTEWAKPSSLNCVEDGVHCNYRSEEERKKVMDEVMNGKFKKLVSDLFKKLVDNCEQLDERWVDIITPLAWEAASSVNLNASEGKTMDPAGHVKIKCIASGTRSESRLFNGLVFKKHAAHKHMPTKYKNPRLLLIEGMLDQSSASSGLSSFSSLMTQDKDCISELIENLKASHADVILVEKSASRDVLEEILKLGVTLVLDMKLHRLQRVARLTDSPILSSDVKFSQELKQCESLRFEKFIEEHAVVGEGLKKPSKTLMFVEGFPKRLGCTILLKGSRSEELKKIKCVVQCAVVMAYHFILETSFLIDQKAMFSTISFGQAIHESTSEESASVVCETSVSHHNMEPNVGGALADGEQIPISSGCDDQYSHAQDSTSRSASTGSFEVPITGECHVEESTDVEETSKKAVEPANSNGFHEEFSHRSHVVDGLSTGCYDPHMGTLSTESSSINDALRKVSIVSPATYQHMSSYIDLNKEENEAQSLVSVPVSTAVEPSDNCDVEAKGNSKEEKTTCNDSQPTCALNTASVDAKKVDEDEECIRPKEEISSVLDSESILVLTSSRNAKRGTICEQSHFSHIKFYRNFDVPLGKFLQDNLFNQNFQCKACGELRESHFYYYAHHNKQLTIRVKHLGDEEHLPGESKGKLWMWSRCGKCKPDEKKATKRVLISTAARGLSFGKFLELSFSNHTSFNRLSRCGHSFQKDFLYFFGLGSMVAMFRYSRVTTYRVSVPAEKLEFSSKINSDWLQRETESVHAKGSLLFTEVGNYLKKIENRFSGSNLVLNNSSKAFADILDMLKLEQSEFEDNVKNTVIEDENSHDSVQKLLSLNRFRWEILLEACVWDCRLQCLLSLSSLVSSSSTDSVVPGQMNFEGNSVGEETDGSHTATFSGVESQMIHKPADEEEKGEASNEEMQGQTEKHHSDEALSSTDKVVEEQMGSKVGDAAIMGGEEISDKSTDIEVQVKTALEAHKPSVKEFLCEGMLQGHGELDSPSLPSTEEHAQGLTSENPYTCGSLLQESENINIPNSNDNNHFSDDNLFLGSKPEERNIPVAAGQDESSCSAATDIPERQALPTLSNEDFKEWVWNPFVVIREECRKELPKGSLPKFGNLPKFKLLNSPDFMPKLSQVISEEESRLHIPVGDDYIVSDYDGEISSSVACALTLMKDQSAPGSDDLDNTTLKRASSEPSGWSLGSSNDPETIQSAPSMPMLESRFSISDGLNMANALISYGQGQLHPEVNLGIEKYPVKSKYSVVIAYASEFRGLRNHCCPSELDYIASLNRCKIWDAKGGKSKSFFARTPDNRLIIKEIKKTEFESFMKFAPEYFRHIKDSFAARNQICLAKILGIYQVTVRHAKSGKETKHDLMVQENLSFGRNITRQYDLKGALHARFTAAADGTGDVLLDGNFVNDMNSSPLYIGQKSKRLLQRAVWNDTTFLNSVNVMDYSLLVGVDRQRRELVCGIIDYLRQYTWDKQLETWVKSSLVVPKNVLPTIISPREYKKRFRKFMDTHFLTVPDHWCSRRSSNPCKLCGIKDDESSSVVKSEKGEEESTAVPCP